MNRSHRLLFLLFISILFPLEGLGQSQIEFQVRPLLGFTNSEIEVSGVEVDTEFSFGGEVRLGYAYSFPDIKLTPAFHMGYKYVNLNGESRDFSIDGTTYRFVMALGVDYDFYSNWSTGLFFHAENNLDFEDWRSGTTDLLRYSISAHVGYEFIEGIRFKAGYQTWMYPRFGHYAVYNPAQYIFLGVNMVIL